MHFAMMIKQFGPVYGWWLFPFEQFNGLLKKVNTNGHDSGRIELMLLHNWVQSYLIYELVLGLPADASQKEHDLITKIVKNESECGGMATQIWVFQSEESMNNIALPKCLPNFLNLHDVTLADDAHTELYNLLFTYAQ